MALGNNGEDWTAIQVVPDAALSLLWRMERQEFISGHTLSLTQRQCSSKM